MKGELKYGFGAYCKYTLKIAMEHITKILKAERIFSLMSLYGWLTIVKMKNSIKGINGKSAIYGATINKLIVTMRIVA